MSNVIVYTMRTQLPFSETTGNNYSSTDKRPCRPFADVLNLEFTGEQLYSLPCLSELASVASYLSLLQQILP